MCVFDRRKLISFGASVISTIRYDALVLLIVFYESEADFCSAYEDRRLFPYQRGPLCRLAVIKTVVSSLCVCVCALRRRLSGSCSRVRAVDSCMLLQIHL